MKRICSFKMPVDFHHSVIISEDGTLHSPALLKVFLDSREHLLENIF
jgi:hypothetical protein